MTRYYKIRETAQNETAILLQNATKVCYEIRQVFQYKKRQLLQNASIFSIMRCLLQNESVYGLLKSFKVIHDKI